MKMNKIEKLFFSFSFSFSFKVFLIKFKEFEHVRCGEHVGCCISYIMYDMYNVHTYFMMCSIFLLHLHLRITSEW